MKQFFFTVSFLIFFTMNLQAQNSNVDILLEKVQEAKTKKQRDSLISQLKLQLAKTNQKAREESDAIVKAKKKLPSKLFKVK
ncbi:hypothetical protein OAR97_04835 [Arcobacteraceae bacterium]|nr:hypothetical protein [Arcobacteraceae bacterium]